MSNCPGRTLEAFLLWNYDLVLEGEQPVNHGLAIAEAMDRPTRLSRITPEQFSVLVALFGPWREDMENTLNQFDEREQSWRDYAWSVAAHVEDALFDIGRVYLKLLNEKKG